jgi:gas vesicle protein
MKSSLIFLGGLAMGTILGMLIAPESGRVTVRRIRREADRLVDKAVKRKLLKKHVSE